MESAQLDLDLQKNYNNVEVLSAHFAEQQIAIAHFLTRETGKIDALWRNRNG